MILRNYVNLERYLNELMDDVYPQPPDAGHRKAMKNIIKKWLPNLQGLNSVLDAGCGQGQTIPFLQRYASRVVGVTLGSDADICQAQGLEVYQYDMSFLPFADGEFDLIFSRHSLEHSPMPLVTLMEWYRVSRQWLLLVVPSLEHFGPFGRNHYYVLTQEQWLNILVRAGWGMIWKDMTEPMEYRFMCEKTHRRQP